MTRYDERLSAGGFAIFLFHGVVRRRRHGIRNYTGKHLPLDRFVEILRSLRAAGTPTSMPAIAAAAPGGAPLPDRAFAVTFDDGFENNASVAAPVLADLGIPATFYVTTGFVGAQRASWIDLVEEAVEAAPVAHLPLPGRPDVPSRTPEEKRALLDAVRDHVKGDPAVDPYAFAESARRALGVGPFRPDPDLDAKLSWDQVRALDADPLFTIGGHGATHRVLAYLDPPALAEEIDGSLERLRRELGRPVDHFSYPEGLAHCLSDAVIDRLRRAGVACAPTAIDGVNHPGDDLFRLRRIMVSA